VPTREAAERLELDLKLRKVGGAAAPEKPTTLGDEFDGYLNRLRATRGLRPRSLEFYEHKVKAWKSLRNVERVHLLVADQLNTYDVLISDDVVFTQGALDAFLAGPVKGSADAKDDSK